jgi:hypothetical protein
MADAQELPSITRLIDARRAEKTRFIVIGMTAAILQGTPATTLDIDLWIDLPPRQYIRLLNLARRLGAEIVANTSLFCLITSRSILSMAKSLD